jgi:glycosyltransferase involved in cell wall biosynthesis
MKKKALSILMAHLGGRDGGAERQSAALASGLVGNGHKVLLLVRRGTPVEKRALEAGAPIFSLQPNFPSGPGGIFTRWSRERLRMIAGGGPWDLAHFADPGSYDKTIPHLSGASGNGSLPSRLSLITYRGDSADSGRKHRAILSRHARAGGPVQPTSEALWSALVRDNFDEDRLKVVHPGIPISTFTADKSLRAQTRSELGIADDIELIGTSAVMDRERGLRELIEAFAILAGKRPKARLIIAGEGKNRHRAEAQARTSSAAERITFTGWRDNMPSLMQALDLFAFTGQGQGQEVFPLALIEAMAASVPVVVRDQPGIREIMENGKQGLIVPGNTPEEFARTMARIFLEKEEATKIGRAGAVRVQRFHTQAMVDATEVLYYRIVQRKALT